MKRKKDIWRLSREWIEKLLWGEPSVEGSIHGRLSMAGLIGSQWTARGWSAPKMDRSLFNKYWGNSRMGSLKNPKRCYFGHYACRGWSLIYLSLSLYLNRAKTFLAENHLLHFLHSSYTVIVYACMCYVYASSGPNAKGWFYRYHWQWPTSDYLARIAHM